MENEIWKPVVGYEAIYDVSNFGRVRSARSGYGTSFHAILKPRYTNDGYIKVALYKDKKRKQHLVHRLVVAAFIAVIGDNDEIDHINGIKDDNSQRNLEPVSRLENMQRSFRSGRNMAKGEKQHLAKTNASDVAIIKLRLKNGDVQKRIAEDMNLSCAIINGIATGKTWRHIALP